MSLGIGLGISPVFRGPASFSGDLDALLQAFANGDYDNGYFDAFDSPSGFPNHGDETLAATTRLGTPAVASIVSSTDIILTTVDGSPLVIARSEFANDKYYRLTKSDHTSGAIYGSAGPAGSVAGGDDPDLIVADPDSDGWFSGDALPLSGLLHVRAVADALDYIAVTASTLTPPPSTAYTATAQLKNAGGTNVHRIGIALTASYVSTAGPGDGSISTSSVTTNKNGASVTISATCGTYPTVEHIHVTDGTHTGDSSDVVVQSAITKLWSTKKNSVDAGSGVTTDAVDTTGTKLIQIWAFGYSAAPGVSDSKGNTWTARSPDTGTTSIQVYECVNPVTDAAHTFFAGSPAQHAGIIVVGFSNVSDTPFDQSNYWTGPGNIVTGAVTPSENNELLTCGIYNAAASAGVGIDGGFAIVEDLPFVSGQSIGGAVAYLVQTTATSANPLWSGIDSGNFSEAVILTYKRAP